MQRVAFGCAIDAQCKPGFIVRCGRNEIDVGDSFGQSTRGFPCAPELGDQLMVGALGSWHWDLSFEHLIERHIRQHALIHEPSKRVDKGKF